MRRSKTPRGCSPRRYPYALDLASGGESGIIARAGIDEIPLQFPTGKQMPTRYGCETLKTYSALLLGTCCLLAVPYHGVSGQAVNANEAKVRHCADEQWNKHKRSVIPLCYTADHVSHTNGVTAPHNGLDAESEAMAVTLNTWPDVKLTYDAVLVSGDFVTTRWRMTAHHATTEKQVDSYGITIFRMAKGKIAEDWTTFDRMPLFMAMEKVPGTP